MAVDMDDTYFEQRSYDEYELSREERESLSSIEKSCSRGYSDEETVREHINYLEHLEKSLHDVMRNEQDFGYDNQTLKHDHEKVTRLMKRCHEELHRLEANA